MANDQCGIFFQYLYGSPSQNYTIGFSYYAYPDSGISLAGGTLGAISQSISLVVSDSSPLFLKLVYDGTQITSSYAYMTPNNFTPFESDTLPATPGFYKVGISCVSETATFTQDIGSFTIDATATGPGTQY